MWRFFLALGCVVLQGHTGSVQQGDALRAAVDVLGAGSINTLRFVASGELYRRSNFTARSPAEA
jgi:hypothetical protein